MKVSLTFQMASIFEVFKRLGAKTLHGRVRKASVDQENVQKYQRDNKNDQEERTRVSP